MAAAGEALIGDGARSAPWTGIQPALRRPLRLLDLIGGEPMTGDSIPYSQEVATAARARSPRER